MQLVSIPLLRPSRYSEILADMPFSDRREEVTLNPFGGFFDTKSLASAVKRLTPGRRLLLPAGEHTCGEIRRNISIRGASAGVSIKAPLKVQAESVVFSGLEFYAPGETALEITGGTVIFDNCLIEGGIKINGKAQVFLKNCLLRNAGEGLSLVQGSSVEVLTSHISKCQTGLTLRESSSGAIYHSHIEECLGSENTDWGTGIFVEDSDFYCEAGTLARNGVNVYLKHCREARIIFTHFLKHEVAAVIATARDKQRLTLRSCVFEGEPVGRTAELSVSGGELLLKHCSSRNPNGAALSTTGVQVDIRHARLESEHEAALQADTSDLSVQSLTGISKTGTAFVAKNCEGFVHTSFFSGKPATLIEESPNLSLKNCQLVEPIADSEQAIKLATAEKEGEVITQLLSMISQDGVRASLERMLRQAKAAQSKDPRPPVGEMNFHTVFTGPPRTGKLAAAKAFAEGLFVYGVLKTPEVMEINLSALVQPHSDAHVSLTEGQYEGRMLFVRINRAADFGPDPAESRRILEDLSQRANTVLIMEGSREETRAAARLSPLLEHTFRNFLHFPDYGPSELMTIFSQLCARDNVPYDNEAVVACLALFYLYCERKDRRYATAEGVELLYNAARQRYLARRSANEKSSLSLTKEDLDLPNERSVRLAVERGATFVSFCPSCSKENPWVYGLGKSVACLHCETTYKTNWGVWKDSLLYRRAKEELISPGGAGVISRRVRVPAF